MLKHRLLPLLFASILVTTGAVTFHVLELRFAPSEVSGMENAADQEIVEYSLKGDVVSKRRSHILRWHNHTINLHLRNVRSRWLTSIQPKEPHIPITYPEEHLIN